MLTALPHLPRCLQDQADASGLPPVQRFFIPPVVIAAAPAPTSLDTGWRREHILLAALILCGSVCGAIVLAASIFVAYISRGISRPARCNGASNKSTGRGRSALPEASSESWAKQGHAAVGPPGEGECACGTEEQQMIAQSRSAQEEDGPPATAAHRGGMGQHQRSL